jgi:nicotinamide-nucleotide amidase
MAAGVGKLLSADVVAAVTGAGGPGEQEGKPAGTVFLAHGRPGSLSVEELHLDGDPEEVVQRTVDAALAALATDLEEARR